MINLSLIYNVDSSSGRLAECSSFRSRSRTIVRSLAPQSSSSTSRSGQGRNSLGNVVRQCYVDSPPRWLLPLDLDNANVGVSLLTIFHTLTDQIWRGIEPIAYAISMVSPPMLHVPEVKVGWDRRSRRNSNQ